jgi:hypothetical protein
MNIKTKTARKDIKALDKAAIVTRRVKDAFVRTRKHTDSQHTKQENYVEYAGDKVKESAETGVQKAGSFAQHQGKTVFQRARREIVNRGYTRGRARQVTGRTARETGRGAIKAAQKSVKTASSTAKTTVKTSRAAAKTAAKTAQVSVKAAQRAVQVARMAVKVAITTAKAVIKAIIAAVKAAIAAVKGLISAIAAGGWMVLVVILVIALVAFLLSSPLGIFTNGGAGNTPIISDEILALNTELTDKITQIQRNVGQVEKTVITFNNEDNSFIDNWPDILAVFAVRTNMDPQNPMDVVVLDEQRISQLRKVFWDMTAVSYEIYESAVTATPAASQSPESTATPAPARVLTISVDSRYWEDMIGVYIFDDEQVDMLKDLMSARYATLFMQLLNSAMGNPATDWSGIIDVPEGGMPIPLYLQGDYPQTVCYIDGVAKSVKTSGCGAASVSMVIAYLTGNTSQTPYTLFKWAYDHGYYSGGGLGHSCLMKLTGLYGVEGTWIENDEERITEALRAGHPVIAHMGPGIFTDSGHYIVLRGITEDGYVLVNDPGSKRRNKYGYKLSMVVSQARTSNSFMMCEIYTNPDASHETNLSNICKRFSTLAKIISRSKSKGKTWITGKSFWLLGCKYGLADSRTAAL